MAYTSRYQKMLDQAIEAAGRYACRESTNTEQVAANGFLRRIDLAQFAPKECNCKYFKWTIDSHFDLYRICYVCDLLKDGAPANATIDGMRKFIDEENEHGLGAEFENTAFMYHYGTPKRGRYFRMMDPEGQMFFKRHGQFLVMALEGRVRELRDNEEKRTPVERIMPEPPECGRRHDDDDDGADGTAKSKDGE